MQVLDLGDKDIILLEDTNCDVLPNYLESDSLNNNLSAHSMRIQEFYDLFGFQQLIEAITRKTLLSSTLFDHIATTNKSHIVTSSCGSRVISNICQI